jgi:hypothetical protein
MPTDRTVWVRMYSLLNNNLLKIRNGARMQMRRSCLASRHLEPCPVSRLATDRPFRGTGAAILHGENLERVNQVWVIFLVMASAPFTPYLQALAIVPHFGEQLRHALKATFYKKCQIRSATNTTTTPNINRVHFASDFRFSTSTQSLATLSRSGSSSIACPPVIERPAHTAPLDLIATL